MTWSAGLFQKLDDVVRWFVSEVGRRGPLVCFRSWMTWSAGLFQKCDDVVRWSVSEV